MTKQPDGYCAWHPEKGPDLKSLRKAPHSSYYRHSILLEGWQIKPVWISTEPPVSKEMLLKLKAALKARLPRDCDTGDILCDKNEKELFKELAALEKTIPEQDHE